MHGGSEEDTDQAMFMDLSFENPEEQNDQETNIEIEIAMVCENIEAVSTDDVPEPAKKRNRFVWKIDSEWDDLDSALEFLESEGYVCYDYSDLKMGIKFYFRCKIVPRRRKQWCAKRYTLFLPSNSTKILILCNQHEHDHDVILKDETRPPSDEMEEFMADLFKCGTTKITEVICHIDLAREKRGIFKNEKNPEPGQIRYSLSKYRAQQAPPMVKLGDMIKWCEENDKFPTDVNQAFVIGSQFSTYDDNLWFRFSYSTPLLLEILSNCTTICIDATYKLNWLGFPLVILGTVDRQKHFHPLVFACCSHERTEDYEFVFACVKEAIKTHLGKDFEPEILIADGADPIRNAWYNSYESAMLDVMHTSSGIVGSAHSLQKPIRI